MLIGQHTWPLAHKTLSTHVGKTHTHHGETLDPRKRLWVNPRPKYSVQGDIMTKVAIPLICREHNDQAGRHAIGCSLMRLGITGHWFPCLYHHR